SGASSAWLANQDRSFDSRNVKCIGLTLAISGSRPSANLTDRVYRESAALLGSHVIVVIVKPATSRGMYSQAITRTSTTA
ncbi:MAG: hypothetical protein ACK53L_10070, partial [Pirellulaceae bacterium]